MQNDFQLTVGAMRRRLRSCYPHQEVVTLEGDGSYDPDDIPRFLAAAEAKIGKDPRDHSDDHEIGDKRAVPQRPF